MKIRLAEEADTPQMLAIYSPFILHSNTSFELSVPSIDAFRERVKAVLAEAPWLVCETPDGRVAGFAYAGKHRERPAYRWTRELSVYIHQNYRGQNIATALYTALIGLLRLQGYANTLIGITLPNDASVRFHEKMGFKPIGVYHNVGFKAGAFHDVGWWEMAIADQLPGYISGPEAILDTEDWEAAIAKGEAYLRKRPE
ncbi:MAG TPA: N-acetyltransferase family protein [Flavilitoribacter sp.]|nr:N-acetyltransferase family protein [Flavilitoribacter sp.]HMQ90690.1 N-acetyltransferase family protein [Flavilitoribacter sp.]